MRTLWRVMGKRRAGLAMLRGMPCEVAEAALARVRMLVK
jgi:hypothetical protein